MAIVSASCGKYSEQTAPEDFEVRITSADIDAHLTRIRTPFTWSFERRGYAASISSR